MMETGTMAIRAIQCVNDIAWEMMQMKQQSELEENFSVCVEKHLGILKPGTLVFWAPRGSKGTGSEATRLRCATEDERLILISQALMELNAEYASVPFLEQLILRGIGKSHVFSIRPDDKEISLFAFPGPRKRPKSSTQSNSSINGGYVNANLVAKESLSDFLNKLHTTLNGMPAAKGDDQRKVIADHAREWCKSWRAPSDNFISLGNSLVKNPIDSAVAESAVAHFALLSLFALVNDCMDISYILASTVEGRCPSSMAVMWPDKPCDPNLPHLRVRYEDIGLPFLLQLILGTGALKVVTPERFAEVTEISYGLAHPLKHRLGDLEAAISVYAEKVKHKAECAGPIQEWQLEVQRLRHFAEMAHLMHYASVNPDLVFKAKSDGALRFATIEPLDIKVLLERLQKVTQIDIEMLLPKKVWIDPYELGPDGEKVRLKDATYELLIWDMLLNVRHAWSNPTSSRRSIDSSFDRRVRISVVPEPGSNNLLMLSFENDIWDEATIKHKSPNDGSNPPAHQLWDQPTLTGLSFISKTLTQTRSGRLWWRCWRGSNEVWKWSTMLELNGLKFE